MKFYKEIYTRKQLSKDRMTILIFQNDHIISVPATFGGFFFILYCGAWYNEIGLSLSRGLIIPVRLKSIFLKIKTVIEVNAIECIFV